MAPGLSLTIYLKIVTLHTNKKKQTNTHTQTPFPVPLTFFKWLDIELEFSGKTESIQLRMRRFCLVVVPPAY